MTVISKYFTAIEKVAKTLVPVGVAAPAAFVLSLALYGAAVEPASALPSFARQTGQPCAACHTAFPQLTPFGRRFKLGGYTLEGGDTKDLPPIAFMVQSTFTRYGTGLNEPAGGTYSVPSPDGGWPNQITSLISPSRPASSMAVKSTAISAPSFKRPLSMITVVRSAGILQTSAMPTRPKSAVSTSSTV